MRYYKSLYANHAVGVAVRESGARKRTVGAPERVIETSGHVDLTTTRTGTEWNVHGERGHEVATRGRITIEQKTWRWPGTTCMEYSTQMYMWHRHYNDRAISVRISLWMRFRYSYDWIQVDAIISFEEYTNQRGTGIEVRCTDEIIQ